MRFEKLVRDFIPGLILRHGDRPVTRILDEEEFGLELTRKLREEVDEFCESGTVEELADILEVVYALAGESGIDRDTLEEIRGRKRRERGGFEKRIFLVETHAG